MLLYDRMVSEEQSAFPVITSHRFVFWILQSIFWMYYSVFHGTTTTLLEQLDMQAELSLCGVHSMPGPHNALFNPI